MSFKLGGFLDSLGSNNQLLNNSATTPPLVANTNAQVPERYTGGTLSVTVKPNDTQQTFVHRGFVAHAKAAGLSNADAKEFADKWTSKNTTFNHRTNGQSTPYTDKEFQDLKSKGKTTFDLTEEFDGEILADLNQRVDYNEQFKSESVPAYTPEERAANYNRKAEALINP